MKIEKLYQKMNDISQQQTAYERFSPEWNALEKQRMNIWIRINDRTGHKALRDGIRNLRGCHIEGTCI